MFFLIEKIAENVRVEEIQRNTPEEMVPTIPTKRWHVEELPRNAPKYGIKCPRGRELIKFNR